MAMCPLIQNECVKNKCEWWGGGIQKCIVVAFVMMMNTVHDMSVMTFQRYVTGEQQYAPEAAAPQYAPEAAEQQYAPEAAEQQYPT